MRSKEFDAFQWNLFGDFSLAWKWSNSINVFVHFAEKGQISISVHFWAAEVEALLCRQLVLLQREFPPSVGALKPGVREVFRPGFEAFEAPGALVVASWCRLGAREGWHWLNGAWMGGGRGLKSTFFAYFRNFFAWNQISNRSRLKYFENCSKTEQLRNNQTLKLFFWN